ncbi:MAG: hypothetical protein AAGF49_04045 [Pseudomonadota bacterium]
MALSRTALLAAASLLTLAVGPASAQSQVGVAGAVNPQSERDRSGDVRTIVIGDDVLFKDRIITGEIGLVQVMFVDGSTFTVGPTARVVIDEFVFNPSTSSGSLVAEVTSGALRFVGGKLSKGNNAVRFRTPGGTLGVRGGIVNIDQSPSCLADGRCPTATASLVFGVELNLAMPDGGRRRIHRPGYSFVFFGDGRVEVVPTSELDQSSLQQRLTGQVGRSGGSPNIPTAAQVVESGVPVVNSERRPIVVLPRPKPTIVTSRYSPNDAAPGVTTTTNVIDDVILEPATDDFIDGVISEQEPPDPPNPPGPPFPVTGNITAFLTPETFQPNRGATVTAPGQVGIVTPFDLRAFGAELLTDEEGTIVALRVGEDTLPFPSELGETEIAPFVSQTLGIRARGTVVRGPNDFALYYLQEDEEGDAGAEDVVYFLTGEPTARDAVLPTGETDGAEVRAYALSDDMQKRNRGIRSEMRHLNPLVAREFGDALGQAAETPFFIVGRPSGGDTAQTLYAGLLIDGEGVDQRSAVNVDTGAVSAAGDVLQVVGRRRGGYRLSSTDGAVAMTGATGSLSATRSGERASLYGEDGETFVYTSGVQIRAQSERETKVFLDRQRGEGLLSQGELHSSTTQVASLIEASRTAGLTRSSRTINGFAAGMMEPNNQTARVFRSTGAGDFTIRFNAQDSNLGGVIGLSDVLNEDPVVRSYRLAFGTDLFGASSKVRSTYVDDDMFAAVATGPANEPGSPQTTVTTDNNVVINHERTTPDTYMISADAVPQPQLFANAGVEECECRFMEWGWWGTSTDFRSGGLRDRRDTAHLGTWVAGDVTPEADLPTVGSGTYEGHVVGNVSALQEDGSRSRYVATGELDVTYDFGARTGTLEVSNFDGRSFAGTIAGGVAPDGRLNQFRGRLSGSGLRGTTDGAFARGPRGPAQGVLGAFDVRGSGYKATGTYLGERVRRR